MLLHNWEGRKIGMCSFLWYEMSQLGYFAQNVTSRMFRAWIGFIGEGTRHIAPTHRKDYLYDSRF